MEPKEILIQPKTTFYLTPFSKFYLEYKPKVPITNREYIQERVDYFFNQLGSQTEDLPYLNILHLAKINNEYLILDGQHRFRAFEKFFNQTKKDFMIPYILKECNTQNEVRQYFRDLNNNFCPNELIIEDSELEIAEVLKIFLLQKYKKQISNSQHPKFPNFNMDKLIKTVFDIFGKTSSSDLTEKIIQLNQQIGENLHKENYPLYQYCIEKNSFFLPYLYSKSESETKRKSFPQARRIHIWDKFFLNQREGNCYVCNKKIKMEDYHVGHSVSLKNGGSNDDSNLFVLCCTCNLSMGSMNMEEFKQKFFS